MKQELKTKTEAHKPKGMKRRKLWTFLNLFLKTGATIPKKCKNYPDKYNGLL